MGFKSDRQRKAVMAKLMKGDIIRTRELGRVGIYEGVGKGRYQVAVPVKDTIRVVGVTDKPVFLSRNVPMKYPSGKPISHELRIKFFKELIRIESQRRVRR